MAISIFSILFCLRQHKFEKIGLVFVIIGSIVMMKDSSAEKVNETSESIWNYLICLGAVIGGLVYFSIFPKLIKDTPILVINVIMYQYGLIIYTVITFVTLPRENLFSTHPTEGYFGYLSSWN